MVVVCLDKSHYHLTVGKNYDVEVISTNTGAFTGGFGNEDYLVLNDLGTKHYVESRLFKELSVIRDEKINELGI